MSEKKPWLPPGTRLVLASENLLEQFGTRTERGERITAEWGEQHPQGWYEPIFTVHGDDNLLSAERARIRVAVEGLPLTGMGHDIPRASVLTLLEADHDR